MPGSTDLLWGSELWWLIVATLTLQGFVPLAAFVWLALGAPHRMLLIARILLVAAWLLFTLRSFRVYRPLSSFAMEVLTHKFQIGELSLSLGSLVSFALATMFAFWVAYFALGGRRAHG